MVSPIDIVQDDKDVVQDDVDPKNRKYWVVWEEGERYPDLIFELLSQEGEGHPRPLASTV